MNKKLTVLAAAALIALPSYAGGFFQNTNQNAAFLRQPAHNAVIGIEGAYFNPAGIGFMDNGWHLGADWQVIWQRRYARSTFAPLAYGAKHPGETTVKYTGKTDVPFLPHIDAAYVHDNFFASFHFGTVTGGGAADFSEGLGSLEAPAATLAALMNGLTGQETTYNMDMAFKGSQYNFAGQMMLGYKINEHIALSAGVRMNYLWNDYDGSMKNAQYGLVSFGTALQAAGAPAQVGGMIDGMMNMEIDAHQEDIAFNPIVGIDVRYGKWNVAARYEFRTAVRMENDDDNVAPSLAVAKAYEAGTTIRADIPASLSLGAEYSVLPNVRLSAGFNYYFDKDANEFAYDGKNVYNKQELLGGNPWEVLLGAEWDIDDKWTVSAGGHVTRFDFGDNDAYLSDMLFSTPSYSIGAGFRYHVTPRLAFDFAAYSTFYCSTDKHYDDYSGLGSMLTQMAGALPAPVAQKLAAGYSKIAAADVNYDRSSLVLGMGVTFDF